MNELPERLPPNHPEAEIGVLGCILLDPTDNLTECLASLPEVAFYDLRNRIIYSMLIQSAQRNEPIDRNILAGKLRQAGTLEQIGGMEYLDTLEQSVPSALNLGYYLPQVVEAAALRGVIAGCTEVIARAMDGDPLAEVLGLAEKKISIEFPTGNPILDGKGASQILVEDLERRHQLEGKLSGIDTGFQKFNYLTEGLQFGEQTLIAARPSMGKTALGLNIVRKVAMEDGIPTLFVSLEMSTAAVMRRLLSDHAEIPMGEIRRGTYTAEQFQKFVTFQSAVRKSPLHIFDCTGGIGIGELSARVRRHVRKHGIKLVVIDYLQKIKASRSNEKRTYEVGEVSERLKGLAVQTNVALLTMAQLNRESEKEKGKGRAPRLSDLADSGQIERDADTVAMIHRKRDDKTGETTLIISKQRDGELGIVPLFFNGTFCRFENPTQKTTEPKESSQPYAD